MGDGADMAISNAFDDEEELHQLKSRGASAAELYDAGHYDEEGVMYLPWGTKLYSRPVRAGSTSGAGGRYCPRCGGAMTLRRNSSTGQQFYGCLGFPKCRGSTPTPTPKPDTDQVMEVIRRCFAAGETDLRVCVDTALKEVYHA